MKKKLSIAAFLALVIIAVCYILLRDQHGFRVTVKNHTNQDIQNMWIDFPGGSKAVSVNANSTTKITVTPENFGEGSISLRFDGNGNEQREFIFGYIETGYSGTAVIEINAIKDNGELEMKLDAKLDSY